MKCYYTNRDCEHCTKKRACSILYAWLDQKNLIERLEMELEEKPEKEEDLRRCTT